MLQDIYTCFSISLLTLNFNKTQYVEFRTKNYYNVNTQIQSDQKGITNSTGIKFLGLIIDDTLSWKQHIEHVVNRMGNALRNIKYVVPINALRVMCFAHIHSIMSYGIIFWGGSSIANKVFILQKRIIRIITNTKPRDSCRKVLKNMEIMTLYSQYIYLLILYTVNNKHLFNSYNKICKYKTRNINNLHFPTLTYQSLIKEHIQLV